MLIEILRNLKKKHRLGFTVLVPECRKNGEVGAELSQRAYEGIFFQIHVVTVKEILGVAGTCPTLGLYIVCCNPWKHLDCRGNFHNLPCRLVSVVVQTSRYSSGTPVLPAVHLTCYVFRHGHAGLHFAPYFIRPLPEQASTCSPWVINHLL